MLNTLTVPNSRARLGQAESVSPRARRLFGRGMARAQRMQRRAERAGQFRTLASLSSVDAPVINRHAAGTQAVALDTIRGSVDKVGSFDADFLPLVPHVEERWVKVATALLHGLDLPPVDLILVGDTYFVVDGHHRISASRMLGYSHIDAVVTQWELAG